MKTCLVVDDSRTIRKVARQMLESSGLGVTEARNGAHALQICRQRMPDSILLDWNMPVMNGMAFLQALRHTEEGAAPIVIFCTTESDLEHVTDALLEGANDYIVKPFDLDVLLAKFGQVGLLDS